MSTVTPGVSDAIDRSCAPRDSLSMMELGGEKVPTSPTFQATHVDMTRKKTSARKTTSQIQEGATAVSNSNTGIRGSQLHLGGIEGGERQDEHTKERHRHRHKHRHKHRHQDYRSDHEEHGRHESHKHKHGQELSRLISASSQALPQAVIGSNDGDPGFYEDRRGDQYNVTYGSVHRYSIPRYRTAGHQRVLGLGRTHKISQSSDGNIRVIKGDQNDPVVRAKAHSLLVGHVDRKKPPIQVVARGTTTQATDGELQRDFLALNGHGSRKRRHVNAQELEENIAKQESVPQRRPMSDSGSEESDSDISSDSVPENSFDQFRHDARQQRRLELSRAVHDHPQDIEAWLALVKHHDDVLDQRDGTTRAPTNAEKYGLADVKISIYETALSKNTSSAGRDRLILGLMDEGAKIWDAKRLASMWKSILRENARFPNLWIKYLDFEQSHFLTFTYDQCKSLYTECLKVMATQPPDSNRDQLCIYVLLRLTAFMKDAGYSEHAVGLWQGVLEYNYFHPDGLEDQARKSSFEGFWNCEVARIGEEGARGWRSGSNSEAAPTSDTSISMLNSAHIFQSWLDCEQERTLNASLPARTLDEMNEDDPYRVIISSDVTEYLFLITKPETKVLLLNAFLCFCGLPPIDGPGLEQQWWTNNFLRNPELSLVDSASDCFVPRDIVTASPMTNLVTETSTMFADSDFWFSCWRNRSSSNSRNSTFEKLVLRQLVDALPKFDHLAEYSIAYQIKQDLKEARKLAKVLLKQRSSDLPLYNAYALVECRLGNLEAAERVWSTALSMSSTFADNDRQKTILLWRTWIWQLLDRAEPSKAFALMLAIPEGRVDVDKLSQQSLSVMNEIHSTALLKVRRTLESNLAHAISLHHTDLICHYSDLMALLAYLNSNYSLTAALAVYSTVIDPPNFTSARDPMAQELLHQSRARLIHLHTRIRTSFRPLQINSTLAESVRRFPNNTIFLTLYHHHTQRSLLMDRIRTVLPTLHSASTDLAAKDSIIPAVFEIWSEMNRPSYAGSTSHSIRAAFERAIEAGTAGSHCPGIWMWYLRWELRVSDTIKSASSSAKDSAKLAKPQDVFYRGMRACPWAKGSYMLAFTEPRLREAIAFAGLRKIYETMVEKRLRIHVDLGDMLELGDVEERGGERSAGGNRR